MNKSLDIYTKELIKIDNINEYDKFILRLNEMLQNEKYEDFIIQHIKMKEKYFVNKFSDESTRENMFKAKDNLICYLNAITSNINTNPDETEQKRIEKYLCNFHLFLETLKEVHPDKRSTLTSEKLQEIQINNEYDLQHILYANLKPFYIDARKEVTEDSGVGAIRSDIKISSLNCIIETKCTRKTMSLKKLTEEIEADIVHYDAKFLFFYIYDKEKIIIDKYNFMSTFNKTFDKKEIRIIILQPMQL